MKEQGNTIELVRIEPQQATVLEKLLELYVYDFTEYMDFDLDENGLYTYPYENYITTADHHAYFIKVNQHLAGFVFVEPEIKSDPTSPKFTIEAFFVMRKYRRLGIGKHIALELFKLYQGNWLIFQSKLNYPAQSFWRSIISTYTNNDFREYYKDGKPHQEFNTVSNHDGNDQH